MMVSFTSFTIYIFPFIMKLLFGSVMKLFLVRCIYHWYNHIRKKVDVISVSL